MCSKSRGGSTTSRTRPRAGHVYVAPSGYHLLLDDGRFVLSVDPRVGFARPSIDVLFESAAAARGARTVGVIMTGANSDGAAGLKRVRERGGLAVVQAPADAEVDLMPVAALDQAGADHCGTSTMKRVPRTPSREVGVLTFIASRRDLAMRPETTASEPLSTCVTKSPCCRVRS